MSRNFSLSFLTVSEVTPVEAIEIAANVGYDSVGLRLLPSISFKEAQPLVALDNLYLKEIQAALRDTGVAVSDVEVVRIDQHFDLSALTSFLESAQALSAAHILVVADDSNENRLIENFTKFAEQAKKYQLTCNLEFMPWTQVNDLKTARRIVEHSGADNAGVLINSLYFFRSSATFGEVQDLPSSLINYIQVCDASAIFDSSYEGLIQVPRLAPGEGQLPLKRLVDLVSRSTTIAVEVPNARMAQSMSAEDRAAYMLEKSITMLNAS